MAGRAFKITQASVEAASCPPDKKDALLFDSVTRGFGLRVARAGTKTFLAQYRGPVGVRRVVIGTFGVLTVDEARKKAKAILGAAAEGRDLEAEQKAREVQAKREAADAAFTFRVMVKQWAEARKGDRRPSYLTEAVRCCTQNLPGWQSRPAKSIAVREGVRAFDAIKAEKGTTTANRTLAYARAAYGWANKKQLLEVNPLKGIERPGREKSRDRALDEIELGAIWRATTSLTALSQGYVRALLLTMQRGGEVALMEWSELSTDLTTWTLPGAKAKNGRATIIHLSGPAREAIRAMPRVADNPYVFAGTRKGKPIGGISFAKRQVDQGVSAAGSKLAPWSFHDFRRSGVTLLAAMGFAPHVCDRILNHITGSIQGVAAVYQRHEFLAERKAALDAWAAAILRAAEGKPGDSNVVALRGAA